VVSNDRKRANSLREIQDLEQQAGLATERIAVDDQLFAKGLITEQQKLDSRQRLADIQARAEGRRGAH
jgi:hypothetical protein